MKRIISIILTLMILVSCVHNVFASGAYDEAEKYIYRTDTYDFPILGDPQHITDEEFFGVWDVETCQWETVPYFRYDEFPEMAKVEDAVKAGDYDTAKRELMNYYTPKKYDKIEYSTSVSATDWLEAEMSDRNFYAANINGQPIAITHFVNQEWQAVSITEVLSYIKSAAKAGDQYVTFVIASMDKSNTPAEIKSKETDSPPTLELVVNKVLKQYYPEADSYISPVLNANVNYGNEEYLLAQEYGYVSHWSDPKNPWGPEASATKRTYLKFDISSLSPNDNISSAVMEFTARTAPGGDLTEKELFIYGWKDSSWKEHSVNWNTFSDWLMFSCNDQEVWNYITSASTTEKGRICNYHRGIQPLRIAHLYDYVQDEKYSYSFIRQMMSLIYNVGVDSDVMNALDMSMHIKNVGDGFIKCWDSDYMTPEYFTAFLKHLSSMTDFICETWLEPETHRNNWANYEANAAYWACMKFPEFRQADYWYDCTLRTNKRLMEYGVYDDGVCTEQGLGYVDTWLDSFVSSYSIYNEVKNPYYGIYVDAEGASLLHSVVRNMYYSTAPGYTGFNIGDSTDGFYKKYKDMFKIWYKYLLSMGIDDPELEYIATSGLNGKLPDFTSVSFPNALRTYMRNGWDKDDIALAFTANAEGYHGHDDILSLSMYGYGLFLLTDQGTGGTTYGDTYNYMKSAQQHNLVTVNGGNVKTGVGKNGVEKEQELNDLYNFTTYYSEYFDGADLNQRSIMFLKDQGIFVVNDYIEPTDKTAVNTYTQFWHMLPDADIYITEDGKSEFRSNFASGANVIVAGVDTESMSGVYLEDSLFAHSDNTFIDSKKGVYEREKIGNASYTTLIVPVASGEDYEVETTKIDVGIAESKASAVRFGVNNIATGEYSNYYYYHLNDCNHKQEVVIDNYKTDATAMLVQEDLEGSVLSFFIYDGSYIEKTDLKDKYLFKSASGEVTLGVDMTSGSTAEFSSDKLDTLEDITVYTGFNTTLGSFNGKLVNSSKDGTYIFFGDAPIIKCTEDKYLYLINNWSDVSDVDVVLQDMFNDDSIIKEYDDFPRYFIKYDTSTKKNIVCRELFEREYSSVDEFVHRFIEVVENYDVNIPTTGGGGGGGTSGGTDTDDEETTEEVLYNRGSFCAEIVNNFGFNVDISDVECFFSDLDETNEYYREILICYKLGFIRGYEDATFRAEFPFTNAEIAKVVYDVLSYIGWDVEIPEDAEYDETLWHGMYSWYMENTGIMGNISGWYDVGNNNSLSGIFYLIGDAYQKHIYDLENPDTVPTEYEVVVGENDVVIDDQILECNYAPILVNDAVFCSIRSLSDILDINVCWNGELQQASFGGWNNIISLTVGDGKCVLVDGVTYVDAEYIFENILGDDYTVTADDTKLYAVKIDANSAQFKVDSVTGVIGQTVKVPVEIRNNPGVASVQLKISYDREYLTLTEVVDQSILGNANHSDDMNLVPYVLSWENDTAKEAFTDNGKIVELTFAVADNAPVGEYDIMISYDEVLDLDGEFVDFKIANGIIDVKDHIIGDVNDDGEVDTKDRMTISRHLASWIGYDVINESAADVNCDGKVDTKDRMALSRHLAGWIGYETLPYIK